MSKIRKINKQTENRFLNLYDLEAEDRVGGDIHYYVSSRAKTPDDLKINTRNEKPDGVIIYSLYGEKKDKIVLVRQYRYPLDDYVYELPSGLVDPGETYRQAGIREMKEETGLDFSPLMPDPLYERPFFTSVGMTVVLQFTVMPVVRSAGKGWKIRKIWKSYWQIGQKYAAF